MAKTEKEIKTSSGKKIKIFRGPKLIVHVTDCDGKPVDNVTVIAQEIESGQKYEATTYTLKRHPSYLMFKGEIGGVAYFSDKMEHGKYKVFLGGDDRNSPNAEEVEVVKKDNKFKLYYKNKYNYKYNRRKPHQVLVFEPISDGYGEHVVLKNSNLHNLENLTFDNYEDIYKTTLYKNTPFYHLKVSKVKNKQKITKLVMGRGKTIQDDLKSKSDDYKLVFIPRTLYELIFINKIMSQELNNNTFDEWELKPMTQYSFPYVNPTINLKNENITLSYKMNKLIIEKIQAILIENETPNFPLTTDQLMKLLNNEIIAFRHNLNTCNNATVKSKYSVTHTNQDIIPHSLGIALKDKFSNKIEGLIKILLSATKIEIESTGKFILYQGTRHDPDSLLMGTGTGGMPLSYNTGLFAGSIYDYEGNTFTPLFMLNDNSYGYCLSLPYEDMVEDKFPFYMPVGNTLKQLFGHDQPYHAWTKTTTSFIDNSIPRNQIKNTHYEHNEYYADDLTKLNEAFSSYFISKTILYKA